MVVARVKSPLHVLQNARQPKHRHKKNAMRAQNKPVVTGESPYKNKWYRYLYIVAVSRNMVGGLPEFVQEFVEVNVMIDAEVECPPREE